jgi:hypothetical protein
MSAAPSVKRRLSKPKTNDHNTPPINHSRPKRSQSSASKHSHPPPDISPEQWTSYFDIKTRPDAPKNLKQQLKQSFPETKRKLSLDSFRRSSTDSTRSTDTMGVKDRYPPAISTVNIGGPSTGIKASPLSMASPSPLARQLSVVHEGPGIDIASAIHLLQELKKTASPEELVALHRALLPMQDNDSVAESSPSREDHTPPQHPSRRTSKLPPGLNTRGAPGDDLLRRLGDEVRRPRTSIQQTNSNENLDSTRRSVSGGHAHANRTSYDVILEAAGGSSTPSEEPEYAQAGAYRTGTLRITNGTASPDPGRMLRLSMPTDISAPVSPAALESPACESPNTPDFFARRPMQGSVESFPGPYRMLHSEKRQTSRPLPPPPESDSRRSSDASDLQTPTFDQHTENDVEVLEPTQETNDNPPISEDTPPFVSKHPPRLRTVPSYGGPLTARDVTPDYEDASPSPREIKPSMAQFATRLSTVYGEDLSDDDSPGTPNHALALLTGEKRLLGPRAPKSMQSIKSPRSPRPASMSQIDSGYGSSDASSQRYVRSPMPSTELQRPVQLERDADADSLYTFNEFLKGPPTDTSTPPISPASFETKKEHAKKDLPGFLGLREKVPSKRMSLPASGMNSSDSLASLTSSVGSEAGGKVSKKLRKPMPLPERLKREKSFRVPTASEISIDEFPLVSEEMNKSLEQRYHQPSASDIDANRRASTASDARSMWDDGSRESEVNVPVPSAIVARRNPFARKRSVSRGRKSQNRTQETTESPADVEKPGRFPFLRSLSRSRSRRRASIDSADCNTPTRTDFSPAAPTSGSVTPRPQLSRDASVERGKESWRTGPPIKKKSKSMGMTEEMASELARSKSRDVAGHDRTPMHDRPRMATPKRSIDRGQSHGRSPSVGVPKSGRSVEDFVPGWHSKENSPQSNGPPRPDNARRPFSMYADSIPPMPDLPVHVVAKAARANKLMEKRKKDAFRKSIETPVGSANASVLNSAASSPKLGKVKAAVRAREEQERQLEERLSRESKADLLRPGVRRNTTAEEMNIAVRELQGSSSEQSSILETDSRPNTADPSEVNTAASSVSSQDQTGFSGFDKQAALWRERRKSLGTYLPKPTQIQGQDPSEISRILSPEIVVSRYITPLGDEVAVRAQAHQDPTSEAARHADAYRSLLDDEDACPPRFDIPRSDSAYSSASSGVTVPNYQDLPHALVSRPNMPAQTRTVSGVTTTSSVYSTQYSALPRTRSPGGRVRTPSGKFYAYEPTSHASQAERSRAASLGKLQPGGRADAAAVAANHKGTLSPASSTDGLSTIFSDTLTISSCGGTIRAKPKNPHQRHRFPEPSTQYKDHPSNQQNSSSPRRPRPMSSNSSNLGDRYSGGLGWEWNRESGFGGSAGTRLNGETGTRRKGQRLAESFGVDLGDVPIFLCKSPDGLAPREQHRKGYFGV